MNQTIPDSCELHDLQRRMQQLEARMTMATSRTQGLSRQVQVSRSFGALCLVLSLLAIALTPLIAGPQGQSKYAQEERGHKSYAPFEIVDDQNNCVLRVTADGSDRSVGLWSNGPSVSAPEDDKAKSAPKDVKGCKDAGEPHIAASIKGAEHAFFEARIDPVQATFGVAGGTTSGLVLRYGAKSPRVAMVVTNGKPFMNLNDAGGTVLVELGEGEHGGRLMLTNGSGGTIMQAGTLESGVGTVDVFPQGPGGYLPTAPIAGGAFALKEENRLPGTFICGVGCANP